MYQAPVQVNPYTLLEEHIGGQCRPMFRVVPMVMSNDDAFRFGIGDVGDDIFAKPLSIGEKCQ